MYPISSKLGLNDSHNSLPQIYLKDIWPYSLPHGIIFNLRPRSNVDTIRQQLYLFGTANGFAWSDGRCSHLFYSAHSMWPHGVVDKTANDNRRSTQIQTTIGESSDWILSRVYGSNVYWFVECFMYFQSWD